MSLQQQLDACPTCKRPFRIQRQKRKSARRTQTEQKIWILETCKNPTPIYKFEVNGHSPLKDFVFSFLYQGFLEKTEEGFLTTALGYRKLCELKETLPSLNCPNCQCNMQTRHSHDEEFRYCSSCGYSTQTFWLVHNSKN